MTVLDEDLDESHAYPRLTWLTRWLSGQGEGRVVHPKIRAGNPRHDLYGYKPPAPTDKADLKELFGAEHFTEPKIKIKLPDNRKLKYDIGTIARALGRNTGQIRQWESPPPPRPGSHSGKRRLPRAHRTPGGFRRYTEAEFLVIMEWARKERLFALREDGTVRPYKRALDNFAARVADAFDMLRDGSCGCGGCQEPRD